MVSDDNEEVYCLNNYFSNIVKILQIPKYEFAGEFYIIFI